MNKLFKLAVLLSLFGCKDKFDIALKETDKSLLVVEGTIAVGQDSTIIMLSKTVKVKDTAKFSPVLNAGVSVEEKNGQTFSLKEIGNGKYASASLGLLTGKEYRLHIKTRDNKEYLSDYVVAKITPEIDSISWKKEDGNMVIYANTHDGTNATKYYRWDYDETWEIHSFYPATFQWIGGATIIPVFSTYHWVCWKYGSSSTINIGTSALLTSDVIKDFPLLQINQGSEKLSVRYSIFVKQQSLSKEAYEYLTMMKKNTESLGSIFDPLPSELTGNIHCVSNPGEGVIGYITASSISKKRIFITAAEVGWFYRENCSEVYKVKNNPDSIKQMVPSFLPFADEEERPGIITSYYFATPTCVDCTARGGDLKMPSYW